MPHRYRDGATTTWAAANAACMADGGYLWIPDDEVELTALITIDETWVGASDDATEGTWLDARGAPAGYLPWNTGEPSVVDGGGGEESCAVGYTFPPVFNDVGCAREQPSICECDP